MTNKTYKIFLRLLKKNSFNLRVSLIVLAAVVALAGLAGGLIWWRVYNLSGAAINSGLFGDQSFAGDISLPATFDKPLLIRLADFAISILPLGAQPAHAQTVGNVVKYINAYPNTDVVQTRSFNKIKEDVILKQPGHPAIFEYQIDMTQFDVSRDGPGNLYFFQKGHQNDTDYQRFIIPAPFMVDANGKKSSTQDVLSALNSAGRLVLKPNAEWLAKAKYPVILDPTIEINILNVHSHPQQGENWVVDFTTQGTADLKIIPNDQATIDDDEFVSLKCGSEVRQPQILAGDVIFYPNWNCSGTATVIHRTKTAGNHTLRFEFGLPGDEANRQISYAYNSVSSPIVFRSAYVPAVAGVSEFSATGGTITYTDSSGLNPRSSPAYSGGYTVHTFTGSGTFTVTGSGNVDYLVVAGGGGGAIARGGGGGAGGYRTSTNFAVTAQAYTVTVGGGGASATNGSNSVFSTITSTGGGAGGASGGSGGGGQAGAAGGSGTSGQGTNGGGSSSDASGGGGGATSAGAAGYNQPNGEDWYGVAGTGGAGTASSISGSSVTYAGGGGGAASTGGTGGAGGSGGGGQGGIGVVNGSPGTVNLGGGGGGGGTGSTVGGAGGSGIVIIRYKPIAVVTGVTGVTDLPIIFRRHVILK